MTHQQTSQTHPNLFNPIKEIIIENFQSHKETSILPAPYGQLTVIVGQSRQGKTAIFRALRWLFYNMPDGNDFIRWGTIYAKVTVIYADGTEVIRHRNKASINRYIIRKPGQQEQVYEGFGRGAVPLEVQQITGVSPVEIGEGLSLNLNLAEQLDGPFLGNKSVSSTARAKVLGKLAGTEEVDLAGKTLGTDLYRWRQDEDRFNKDIFGDSAKVDLKTGRVIKEKTKGLIEQIAEYDYLPEFKAKMDRLSVIRDTIKAAIEKRERLNTLYINLTDTNEAISKHNLFIQKLENIIVESERIHIIAIGNVARHSHCLSIKAEWNQNCASIQSAQAIINQTDKLPQAEASIRATEGQIARRQQVDVLRGKWDYLIENETMVNVILSKTAGIHKAAEIAQSMEAQARNKGQVETIVTQWNKMVYDLLHNERILFETRGIFEAETAFSLAEKDMAQLMRLIPIYRDFGTVKSRILKEEWVLDSTEQIPLADISLTELYGKMDRQNRLLGLLDRWNKVSGDMAVVDRQMERTKGIEGAGALVSTTESDAAKNKKLSDLIWRLDGNKKQLMTESILAENAGEEVEKLQTEYYEVLKLAGKCPVCGNEISESCKEKIGEVI